MHVCHQRQLAFCELYMPAYAGLLVKCFFFLVEYLAQARMPGVKLEEKGQVVGFEPWHSLPPYLCLMPFHPSISPTFALYVALWLLQT